MGDPVSITASIAGLISLGLQTTQYLYDYYTKYRDQDKDLARTADRLNDLLTSLRLIDEVVITRKWRPDQKATIKDIENSISRCGDVINELQDEVRKFRKEATVSLPQLIKVAGRRVAYPFRRSTLEKLEEDADDFRNNLSVTLQALQLQETLRTQDDIGDILDVIKLAQAQSLAEKTRNWLKAPDATVDYNVASTKRHPGTGMWFIKGPRFIQWLDNSNSFLWIRGLAGCGKSVLCSTAIQHTFRHQCTRTGGAIAFFFFTFNDSSKQDASALIRALLLQLAGQIDGLDAELTRLRTSYHHGTPPVSILLTYLQQAVSRAHDVYILIDALDESPMETQRDGVLSAIQTMRSWNSPSLHLLVTSRHTIDIEQGLEAIDQETVVMRTQDVDPDILNYVSYQVDHDRQLQRWGEHREMIKVHLTRRSGGMFRWVECQLGPLRKCPQSLKHLQRCLESLPRSLDDTYERMLNDFGEESREEAQRILTLLCYSKRPMTVAEVIDAIAVDLDLELHDNDRKLQGSDDLRRICPGLIEVDVRRFDRYTYEHYPNTPNKDIEFVRIAHFSVQEYLLSDRIKQTQVAQFALSEIEGHSQISKTCLIYLHNQEFLGKYLDPALIDRYPFSKFAAKYWHHHYRLGEGPVTERLSKLALSLFKSSQIFTRWVRLYDIDSPSGPIYYDWVKCDCEPPAYYVASLRLNNLMFSVLPEPSSEADEQGKHYESAMRAALSQNDQDLLQKLLDACTLETKIFGATLEIAARTENEKLMQVLLKHKTDDRALQAYRDRAMTFACQNGQIKIAQMLTASGVKVDASILGPRLIAAAENDERELINILLDNGIDIEGRDDMENTALLTASLHRHEETARMLINRGANVNAHNSDFWQPLHYAAENGCTELVQVLLDNKAIVNAHNKQGPVGSPLYYASYHGRRKVVRILLDHGADVNIQQPSFRPAVVAAASEGHMRITRLLIDHGAEINPESDHGGSLLGFASKFGDAELVQMLLHKGVNVNTIPKNTAFRETALAAASSQGHLKVVSMLLENGADINLRRTESDRTPLYGAALSGFADIVRVLVNRGAHIDAIMPGTPYPTALTVASIWRHKDVVEILLAHGARLTDSLYDAVAESYRVLPEYEIVDTAIDTARMLDAAHPTRPVDLTSILQSTIHYQSDVDSDDSEG